MSKPFNFEEFKAGKPAVLGEKTIEFVAYDEELVYPVVFKVTTTNPVKKVIDTCKLDFLQYNATMLPTKRTVWIAICKHGEQNLIEPDDVFYNSKDEAMNSKHEGAWKVIDAIPYEIEE